MRASLQVISIVCAALLAGTLVSACGTTTAENASLADKGLQGSKARLKINRPGIYGAAVAVRVRVDGREVANLGVGGSTMLDVSAGSHKIVVDTWSHPNEYAITLEAKAGMLYTLEISPRAEAAVAGAVFGLVGMMVEAAANENGGAFQISVVDAKPAKR